MNPSDVVRELITRYSTGRFAEAYELYADDVIVTMPYGVPEPVEFTKKTKWGTTPARMYDRLEVLSLTVHQTSDPAIAIGEYTYLSKVGDSTVTNMNVIVAECKDGKIVKSREYHNHITRAVANGTVPKLVEQILGMTLPEDRSA